MRLFILTCISIFFSQTYCYHPSWTIEDPIAPASVLTNAILKRYYGIHRMHFTMHLVQVLYRQNPTKINQLLNKWVSLDQKSVHLHDALVKVHQERDIAAFLALWDAYAEFKYIQDYDINTEMIQCVNRLSECIMPIVLGKGIAQDTLSSVITDASITEIAFRFYFLKKTDHIFRYLKTISGIHIHTNTFFDSNTFFFKHPIIHTCAQNVFASKSLHPFLVLYNKMFNYDYIDDVLLYKEFLMLTFFMLHFAHNEFGKSFGQEKSLFCNNASIAAASSVSIKNLFDMVDATFAGLDTYQFPVCFKEEAHTHTAIEDLIRDELGIPEQVFALYVFRRLYCINRLSCVDKSTCFQMRHAIRPLLQEWAAFNRYMYLDNQLLIDEFSQEVFLISDDNDLSGLDNSFVQKIIYLTPKELIVESLHDMKPFVHIDDVVLRFYYLERLKKTLECIIRFKDIFFVMLGGEGESDSIKCTHPEIKTCIERMKIQNSVYPLIVVSKDFFSYYAIDDTQFVLEYFKILYLSCESLLATVSGVAKKEGIKYEHVLEHVVIGDLLDAIDSITQQLEQCEVQKKSPGGWLSYISPQHFLSVTIHLFARIKSMCSFSNS